MQARNPFEKKPSPPVDPRALRPDQKRCRGCKNVVLHEEQRCPFCGYAPWLWNPNSRFLLVAVIIAVFLLVLLPLMGGRGSRLSPAVDGAPAGGRQGAASAPGE